MRFAILVIAVLTIPVLAYSAVIEVPTDYTTIQAAIDASVNGDTVIVAPGTYWENINFNRKAITVISSGGADLTVIDGNKNGSVVELINGEGLDSVLDGFTITNGSGATLTGYTRGGGIYCANSSSPTIINNTISGNVAGFGGGIYCREQSSPTITNNTISENNTTWNGGGIYCNSSSPTITNNKISGNSAGLSGGGIHCSINSSLILTNNTITGNTSSTGGGGIYCISTYSSRIINNTIKGNSADHGGGIAFLRSSPIITNTILWDNNASSGQELWIGNTSHSSTVYISYSDVFAGKASVHVSPGCTLHWGDGMIDSDPLFADPGNSDFHITFNSPCRGSGNNTAVTESCDIEGDPRIAFKAVDIGADEFYTHLYHTGDATPGGSVELKLVDLPGTSPVILWIGAGVLVTPINTIYGDWCLQLPLLLDIRLGPIATPSGVTTVPHTFDPTFPASNIPMQALIGKKLSNLCVMKVK